MDCDDQSYLCSEEVIRIAGARFLSRCRSTTSSCHGMRMVDLVETLVAASDRVARNDLDQAAALLKECKRSSSAAGNAIQRLVFYFSEALQERMINSQTARPPSSSSSSSSTSCLPMGVASQFAGVQAIVDEVTGGAKRPVHIIDLSLRNGAQWTILMSALAASSSPPQRLKLTAVGSQSQMDDSISRQMMEETGNRLAGFAATLNMPFSFHIVMVSELSHLKVHMLGLHADYDDDEEEAVAVYLDYVPRKLLRSPTEFDKLMRTIKSIDPDVVVVTEVEANHNSPAFGSRFMESLYFFSAYLDATEAYFFNDDYCRMAVESVYCGESIRNIVACEGEERVVRNVPLRAWRLFFKRFGMVEVEMSSSCFHQARLVIHNINAAGCRDLCTVERDIGDKSLVLGWKGTRLHSVSAWKFRHIHT
ncbi:unnamed protein product [Linum tenue]|uniref:DELLA protein RGL1 n=2 Tax=Linum tenue TaxID=586396 RepID=A0AAV0RF26_9ROSI|nr:unnamed protein product [Linum tenue]